jgi:hypothetical protein
VRAVLWSFVAAGWGLAVNIALQKGWLNQFPDLGVSALFIIPMLICVYLALTHETARQYYPLVRKQRLMTLLIFIAGGCVIGVLGWYAIYKLPLQQPTDRKIAQPHSIGNESAESVSKLPPVGAGRINWNFGSFLGITCGGTPNPQCRVQTFQALGRNGLPSTITKIAGYVEIDRTRDRFPLLLNKDGRAVDLELMSPLENDERVEVCCYFTQDRSRWDGSWPGVESNRFLEHYTPFTFFVSINGGEESKYEFSTGACRALMQPHLDRVHGKK